MEMNKKDLSVAKVFCGFFLVCFILVSFMFSFSAKAETAEGEYCVDESSTDIEKTSLDDYLMSFFYPSRNREPKAVSMSRLTSCQKKIYQIVSAEVEKIYNGERESTIITISASVYDMDYLGITNPDYLDDDDMNRIHNIQKNDINIVLEALLQNQRMKCFWYAHCYRWEEIYDSNTRSLRNSFYIKLTVDIDYRKNQDPYTFESSYANSAKNAAAFAKSIVNKHKAKSDYDKLVAYKNEICALVEYNYTALQEKDTWDAYAAQYNITNISFGDIYEDSAWHLLWVFDNNPATNVVCEGYAEAFQYLCDLSTFNANIYALAVYGNNHMWNLVHMDDGHNYLVDVTWCDTTGRNYFLLPYQSGNVHDGYKFATDGVVDLRKYDNKMFQLYTESQLTVSSTPYVRVTTLEFRDVVCPTNYKIGTTDGYLLSGGRLVSDKQLRTITTTIQKADGSEIISGPKTYNISTGYSYDIIKLDTKDGTNNGVRFSYLNNDKYNGQSFVWVLTATDAGGRTLTLEMPFTASYSKMDSTTVSKKLNGGSSTPTHVYLNKTSLTLDAGASETLVPTIYPSDAANKAVTWTSSNTSVATVDSTGKVTAKAAGTATITVKTNSGNKTATCTVTVIDPTITGQCGDNVIWSYKAGELTISGTGPMYDYDKENSAPWYDMKEYVKTVYIGNGVTSIGNYAFYESRLEIISIPSSVISIGDSAFAWCYGITNMVIPSGVQRIGEDAFFSCLYMTDISLPNSVIYIDDGAFGRCRKLSSITLPENITTLNFAVFQECDSLTEIIIPDGVTEIQHDVFFLCKNLTKITIPASVTSISFDVFYGCDNLTIYCWRGSEAYSYAAYEGIPYVLYGVAVDSVNLNKSSMTLSIGASETLIPTVLPSNAYCKNVIWESNDTDVVTVDTTGKVTAVAAGRATITVTTYDGEKTATCEVTVTPNPLLLNEECTVNISNAGSYAYYSFVPDVTTEYVFRSMGEQDTYGYLYDSNWNEITHNDDGEVDEENEENFTITSILNAGSTYYLGVRLYGSGATGSFTVKIEKNARQLSLGTDVSANIDVASSHVLFYYIPSKSGSYVFSTKGTLDTYGVLYDSNWNQLAENDDTSTDGNCAISYDLIAGDKYFFDVRLYSPSGTGSFSACVYRYVTGSCGDNVTWSYGNGKLTISGTGPMYNYDDEENFAPWYEINQAVKTVYIGNGVTSIGNYAFNESRLETVSIPSSVISIGDSAFAWCDMTNISLPDSVTYIGDSAFEYCENLTSIAIPSNIKTLNYGVFEGCESLSDIVIPDGVTKIEQYAFCYCTNLTSIIIPDSVTSIANNAFNDCDNLTIYCYIGSAARTYALKKNIPFVIIGGNDTGSQCGENATWSYQDGMLIISGTGAMYDYASLNDTPWIKDYTVNGDFYNEIITKIVIDQGITSIGNYAFNGFFNLESVSIPSSVTRIGKYAFAYCKYELTNVVIPNGVRTIEEYAFSNCWYLNSISIPRSVISIGASAFLSCLLENINVDSENQYYTSVNGVLFDKGKTKLLRYSAGRMDSSYTIPNSVTSIEESAFSASSLTSIIIPDSVTNIGAWAFVDCVNLTSLTLPNSVTNIGYAAFLDCFNLTSLTIPASVINIGEGAFWDDDNLTIYCYDGSAAYAYAVENNIPYVIITPSFDFILPAALKTIDTKAFTGISAKRVKLPEGCTTIGFLAFANCPNLVGIYIPESCTSIAANAFSGVANLTIYGVDGSYAEFYAGKYGFTFIAVE